MEELNDIDWEWIERNLTEDVSRLRLKFSADPRKMFEIIQIDCRQRYRKKLADTLSRCGHFVFDSTLAGEQSTSDDLACFHSSFISRGDRVLDMTGGLGIDVIHAADRAVGVVMVELDGMRADCARRNFAELGLGNVTVRCGDSVGMLDEMGDDDFDVIYIDPARRGEHGERIYALNQCRPDVTLMLDEMLRVAWKVVIKASPMLDITQILRELHSVSEIVAVGTRDECKEVDIVCLRGFDGVARRGAITILADRIDEFYVEDGTVVAAEYADPKTGGWIYEPYPPVTKLNVGKELCRIPGIRQIAHNTHFYVSENGRVNGFPGSAFEVLEVAELDKRSLRDIATRYPKIDITARNFPMTAAELTKRMKVKPSGLIRLVACRNEDGKSLLVVCRREGV